MAHTFVWELRSEPMAFVVNAFQIDLDVMQGKLTSAGSWALQAVPVLRPSAMPMVYHPQLTVPKALLAVNDPANAGILADSLRDLHTTVVASHNIRYLIEVLALEALAFNLAGDEAAAFAALEHSLSLAAPSGFIRLYVDLGRPMKELLTRLYRRNGTTPNDYINHILEAFPQARRVPEGAMVEPLSNRELQVLELLAHRFSYKEIAQQLFIAPGTVKRHALNIYQKLNVQKRNDAVDAAQRLGILE
jgi:LuxR family maltose regulon positive regulatory protein